MARASDQYRLSAQAEDRIQREITSAPSDAQKRAIEARLKTAVSLYSALKPIADKHGTDVRELIALHTVETRGKGDPMSRESSAGATGPFQVTEITRKEFPPSQEYTTTFERDADTAAQHLAAAKKEGFSTVPGRALTYIAGREGVRQWGGGAKNNVGEHSVAYVPMADYAYRRVRELLPAYLKDEAKGVEMDKLIYEIDRKKAAAEAGEEAFYETPYTPMQEGLMGALFGPSEEEAEASRKARNDARDAAATKAASKVKMPPPGYTFYGYK
jgi:hypothetical protein